MIHRVGGIKMVQSVPMELSTDHAAVLGVAAVSGRVDGSQLGRELGWNRIRIDTALNQLLKSQLIWVDDQNPGERAYWFPSIARNA